MDMENLGKITDTSKASIINRIKEIEESISGAKAIIEERDSLVK